MGFEPTHIGITTRGLKPLDDKHHKLLVPAQGNAPWSYDYQSYALLLSYAGKLLGSDGRIRTADSLRMKEVFYQLNYITI